MSFATNDRSSRIRIGSMLWLILMVTVFVGACDSPLEVELPGQTSAAELDDPRIASLLVRSVQGDFECTYARYVWATGQLSAELIGSARGLTAIPYVQRDVRDVHTGYGEGGCGGTGLYTPLSSVRWFADNVIGRLEGFTDDEVQGRVGLLARASLYSGFARTMFGETFCRATFDLGPALTPTEVLQQAEEYFTDALTHASAVNNAEVRNAALVGRARVRLNLGDQAGALVDAESVEPGFVYYVQRSSADNSRRNFIYHENYVSETVSIDPSYWNLEWEGVPDPRVQVEDRGRLTGGDQQTPLWQQTKYTSWDDPMRLASYVEAQLIIAEIEGGQTAVDIINGLHAAAGIPPFASSDEDEIRDHIILTRAREIFLEGRRMADIRRYDLDFAAIASHGQQHPYQGLPYGSTTCFPLPNAELAANPNVS